MIIRPLYDAAMGNTAAVNAAFFQLQNIRGPVLCLSAQDDELWDSAAQCKMAMGYLKEHHHSFADRAIEYEGPGHTFLFATNGPKSAILDVRLPPGGSMALGGTVQGDM